MSFAKLMGLIGENEDAMELAKQLEASMNELTSKVNSQELKIQDTIQSRDKVKDKLKLFKEKTGIEEITAETIEEFLKVKPDEKTALEINNLKDQLEKAVQERSDIEDTYKMKMSDLVLKTELNKTGLAQQALNPESYQLLEGLVLNGASYTDEGKIVFKNTDGTTSFVDGREMTLQDKVDSLISNGAYSGLLKPTGNGGSGTASQNDGYASNSLRRSEMSHAEKGKYISEHGEEAYFKLAQ